VLLKEKQDKLIEEETQIHKRLEELKDKEKELLKTTRPRVKLQKTNGKSKELKFRVSPDKISIGKKLGSGGSGAIVYSCIVDGWVCAMKQLQSSNKIEVESFEREMAMLYELPKHPNIVQYLFHCTLNGNMCLFMTQYDSTLKDIIDEKVKSNESFSEYEICSISKKIMLGIQHLHKHDIIHRDIKTQNIYCTVTTTGLQEVVIADFDTAKHIGKTCLSTIGTLGYMAPEVFDNTELKSYSYSADIFSFGMVLYSLLSLKEPFYNIDNPFRIYEAMKNGQCPLIEEEKMKNYSSGLIRLHKSCTQLQPDLRPTTSGVLIILEQALLACQQTPS